MSLSSRRCALWILLVLAGTGIFLAQETGERPLNADELRTIRDQGDVRPRARVSRRRTPPDASTGTSGR